MSETWPEMSDGVSPDAPESETPTLLDYANDEDLSRIALDYAQAALPEWSPRAGNTEVVLIEALAQMTSVLAFALEEAPGRVVEQLMGLYGVPRDLGGPARGVVRFEVQPAQGVYVIPAGTTLRITIGSTNETLDYRTTGQLEIVPSQSLTGVVAVVATDVGRQYNGIPVGTALDVVDPLPYVERVRIEQAPTGGRDEESDASLQSRASAVFGRLVSTLVLPQHFRLAALQLPSVGRVREVDLYDPAQPDAEQSVGHITLFVTDPDGLPLSTEDRLEVVRSLREQAMASLIIHVEDPQYLDVDVEVSITVRGAADPDLVVQRVEEDLRSWISPAAFPWDDEITLFQIVARVSQISGVDRVVTVSPDLITLPAPATLPRLGDLTVTVEGAS